MKTTTRFSSKISTKTNSVIIYISYRRAYIQSLFLCWMRLCGLKELSKESRCSYQLTSHFHMIRFIINSEEKYRTAEVFWLDFEQKLKVWSKIKWMNQKKKQKQKINNQSIQMFVYNNVTAIRCSKESLVLKCHNNYYWQWKE